MHHQRLSRLFVALVVICTCIMQPSGSGVAPATAGARAFPSEAARIAALPNTIEITAAAITPTVLEVTAGQAVTFLNSDTQVRRLQLITERELGNGALYLPLIVAGGGAVRITQHTSAPQAEGELLTLLPGTSTPRTFSKVGTYRLVDKDRPTLTAAILVTAQVLVEQGQVTGQVLDFKTKQPIASARVKALDTTIETSSNAQGSYRLPLPPGEYTIVVFANGYTFANRKVLVQSYTPVAVDAVQLVPLDPRVTSVSAAGATAANAASNTNIVFATGAVTTTKAVRLTDLPVDEFKRDWSALPGPFTDGKIPLGFVSFEPDGTQFKAPAVWTIAYEGPLAVGTAVPCYYWIEEEARWAEPVPGAVVDLGGDKKGLRATLPHFSSYGFAAPPPVDGPRPPVPPTPPEPDDGPENNPSCPSGSCPLGSTINMMSGELGQRIGTAGLPSAGGLPTQITAQYHSLTASAAATIVTRFTRASDSTAPDIQRWQFEIAGRSFEGQGAEVNVTWDGLDGNGQPVAPGMHEGKLTAIWSFNTPGGWSEYRVPVAWPVNVRSPYLSPFGRGWFSPHDTLLVDRGNTVTMVQADGRQVTFIRGADGTSYTAPAGDFSTLTHNGDTSWTRAYRDGSSLAFNGDGRLTRIADRYGNFQLIQYESNGKTVPAGQWALTTRIRRVLDTSGNTFDYGYDANGWLASITDSTGRVYRYEHDASGNLTRASDPLDQSETFDYNANGLMARHTDKRGAATSYVLDARGRLVSRSWPTGTTLQMAYSPSQVTMQKDRGSLVVTTLDRNSNPVAIYNGVYTATLTYNDDLLPETTSKPPRTTLYDEQGNVTAVLAATQTLFERDGAFDQVSRVTTSDGDDTHYAYDDKGSLVAFTDTLGQQYSMTYDVHGQPLTIRDPLGQPTTLQYNDRGLVTAITDPLVRITRLDYDAAGNLSSMHDALNRTTTMEHDALNRLTATVDALNGRTQFQYDAGDNLTRVTGPDGRSIDYTFDALNRPTKITYANGGAEHLSYDADGNLIGLADARARTLSWEYDAAGRPVRKQVQGGPLVSYGYDTLDQLTRVDDGTLATTYTYQPGAVNRLASARQIGSGVPLNATVDYDYNARFRTAAMPAPNTDAGAPPVFGARPSHRVRVVNDIEVDTLWTARNVYIVGEDYYTGKVDVVIKPGATLTIEPGTIVKFGNRYSGIRVEGTLIAEGTAAKPIAFTSPADDAHGGDTNGDGPSSALTEQWDGIKFAEGSRVRLAHTFLGYSYYGLWQDRDQSANGRASVSLDHVTISSNAFSLQIDGAAVTATNSRFVDNKYGAMYFSSTDPTSPLTITDNVFEGNQDRSITIWFDVSPSPPAIPSPPLVTIRGNTMGRGETSIIGIYGNVVGQHFWGQTAALPIFAGVSIAPTGTLTLDPGTVIKYDDFSGNDFMQVYGTLNAEGTPGQPIVVANYADDSYGGDSNEDGPSTGAPSYGAAFAFHPGSHGSFSNTLIDYAGIDANQSELRLDAVTIQNSLRAGIEASNSDIQITNSSIVGHTNFGIQNLTPEHEIIATGNYWGHPTGPRHADNPSGQGQTVTDGVRFMPFKPGDIAATGSRLTGVRLRSNANLLQEQRLAYDAIGQLTTLSSAGYATYQLGYSYDRAGQLQARRPATGSPLHDRYGYDAAGQLTQRSISTTIGLLLDERYDYDAVGNLVRTVSNRDGTTDYTYDELGRLIGANGPGLATSYTYDTAGNRTTAGSITYSYDVGGRLTSTSDGTAYGYDAAGNLVSRTRAGQTTRLTWDSQNRLVRITYPNETFSAYGYDDGGRRISKRLPDGTVRYYVYSGEMLLQEIDGGGKVVASYTYDSIDRPISMWRNGKTYFYLLNHLGSVVGLADTSGVLVATYHYDPWGNLLSNTGAVENPLRFTAREYDAESGLYFYRARYYDPQVGRFISRDPIGISGGLNLYAYVGNNPLAWTDPRGLSGEGPGYARDSWWGTQPQKDFHAKQAALKAAEELAEKTAGAEAAALARQAVQKMAGMLKNPFGPRMGAWLGGPVVGAVCDVLLNADAVDAATLTPEQRMRDRPDLYQGPPHP